MVSLIVKLSNLLFIGLGAFFEVQFLCFSEVAVHVWGAAAAFKSGWSLSWTKFLSVLVTMTNLAQLNCKVEMLTTNLVWLKWANPSQNSDGHSIRKIRNNNISKRSRVNCIVSAWLYVIRYTERIAVDDNAVSSLPEISIFYLLLYL